MVDKKHMGEAAPHIEKALRSLEMLRLFVENKENLSLARRVPTYYNVLAESVIALQDILLSDSEYTERVVRGVGEVSELREYQCDITQNHDGDVFYNIDALLPLKRMKGNVLFNGRIPQHVNSVYRA